MISQNETSKLSPDQELANSVTSKTAILPESNNNYANLFKGLCDLIESVKDSSPFGEFAIDPNSRYYDTSFRCDAARTWLRGKDVHDSRLAEFFEVFVQSDLLTTRGLRCIAHNLAAAHAIEYTKNYEHGLHHAEAGFSQWWHDVYNHRLVLRCKALRGAAVLNYDQSLAEYLDRSYCTRPFEHFETTPNNLVYLCSPDYLTPPAADLKPFLGADGKSEVDRDSVDSAAWNSRAAQFIRRSIISGQFQYCSPLTCPLIQGRLLPKRKLDELPPHLDPALPYLVQSNYQGYSIYYYGSRLYAIPARETLVVGRLSDNVLISYSIGDLEQQISDRCGVDETACPIDRRWFQENDLASSVVLTLCLDAGQGRLRQRMVFSPRELMMTHDNSCNISCPSCRTRTIVASRKETEQFDRLVPIFLCLLKDAATLILSGSGDPFASRHFRRLLRAIGGKESEFYGKVTIPSLFRINLMTNGLLINRDSYEEFCLRGRIGTIALSMDACDKESFEQIRRGSKWEDLIAALRFIQTIRHENKKMALISYFTIQRANFRQIPDFIKFCRSYGFQHVQMNMIRNFRAYSKEEFEHENIGSPAHPEFQEFMEIMRLPALADPFVILGNAKDYRELAVVGMNTSTKIVWALRTTNYLLFSPIAVAVLMRRKARAILSQISA